MKPYDDAGTPPGVPTIAHDGGERRVGVEIEFTGLTLEHAAELIKALFGGEIDRDHRHRLRVADTTLGEFLVELDVRLLQQLASTSRENRENQAVDVEGAVNDMLSSVLTPFVPTEVVSPPVPLSRLHELDRLRERMLEAGAHGTGKSPAYAFGLHLNPEAPSLATESLLAYLQSFLLLYEWLARDMRIDITRKLTFFARPFPRAYLALILNPEYRPDRDQFIGEYLAHNPTRNRALDMLPLFSHLDSARVDRSVRDELVKARPTYHYRMPNCRIDDPAWSIGLEWRRWCLVETLASDSELRFAMMKRWRELFTGLLPGSLPTWLAAVDEYLGVAP